MPCCYADELKEGFFPWIDLVNILHYVVSPLGIEHCDELRCWTLISSENWNVFVGRIFLGAWCSSRWWQIDMLIDMVFILLANLLTLFHWAWLLHLWQVAPILVPLLKFYFHEELSLVSVSLLNVKNVPWQVQIWMHMLIAWMSGGAGLWGLQQTLSRFWQQVCSWMLYVVSIVVIVIILCTSCFQLCLRFYGQASWQWRRENQSDMMKLMWNSQ